MLPADNWTMNENHLDNRHIRWPSGIFLLTPKYFPLMIKSNYTEEIIPVANQTQENVGWGWSGGGEYYNVVSAGL